LQFEQQLQTTGGQGLNSKLSSGILAAVKYGKTTKDVGTAGLR